MHLFHRRGIPMVPLETPELTTSLLTRRGEKRRGERAPSKRKRLPFDWCSITKERYRATQHVVW